MILGIHQCRCCFYEHTRLLVHQIPVIYHRFISIRLCNVTTFIALISFGQDLVLIMGGSFPELSMGYRLDSISLSSYTDVPITLDQGKSGLVRPRDHLPLLQNSTFKPNKLKPFFSSISLTDK